MREMKTANQSFMPQVIPAYTSHEQRLKIEKARELYPNDPSKYRRVNKNMDKELVWYKGEIEKRFAKSSCKGYVLPRTAVYDTNASDLQQHFAIRSKKSLIPDINRLTKSPDRNRIELGGLSIRSHQRREVIVDGASKTSK